MSMSPHATAPRASGEHSKCVRELLRVIEFWWVYPVLREENGHRAGEQESAAVAVDGPGGTGGRGLQRPRCRCGT